MSRFDHAVTVRHESGAYPWRATCHECDWTSWGYVSQSVAADVATSHGHVVATVGTVAA